MAKKPNHKLANTLWSIIGILLVLTFALVVVRGAVAIKDSWKDVKDSIFSAHVVEAQAMTYSEDELLEETLPEETPESDEDSSSEEDKESEEDKTTIGEMIDKKGEDLANIINAETGLALSGGAVLIGVVIIFLIKK